MQIITKVEDARRISVPLAIALGNFDGVHRGHQTLIRQCVEESRRQRWEPGIMTFYPHPLQVISGRKIKLLNTAEQKYRLLRMLDIKHLFLVSFDLDFASITPEDFVRLYLVELLKVKKVYVGFNYSFGQKGRGTPQLLEELGRKHGFAVSVTQPVIIDNEIVSSTLIREKYGAGDMEGAARLLGYRPYLEGQVVSGEKRGRTLGFPTANLEVPDDLLLPSYGVYAAYVEICWGEDGSRAGIYPAVANIGIKPTFGAHKPAVEVHILDLAEDLYQKVIKIQLVKKIRPELRFNETGELSQQIRQDIQVARKVLLNPE